MSQQKKNSNLIAIITMFFIFAMISFVTNLAAPFGTIWKNQYDGSNTLGMMGNMMNFLAYLFMGIPAGNLLVKIGYKKTALTAMAVGVIGLFIQYLSSLLGTDTELFTAGTFIINLNFIIYLLGAFICGLCVCMLNTVVNPMLNLLGGGGNKGNQLIQSGGALNSLSATLTPLFVGLLIGTVTKKTTMTDVTPMLFIAMGVFAAAFIIISFIAIPEPHLKSGAAKEKFSHSPWNFRHTVLGVIGIFIYVGIEIGIPSTLNFYIADKTAKGAGILLNGAAIGGAITAIYWLLMLVGRSVSSAISRRVSSRTQLITVTIAAIFFVMVAMFIPKSVGIKVPNMIYNPIEKTTEILQGANVPDTLINAFIAHPSAAMLTPYTIVLNAESEMTPDDVVNSLNTPLVPISAFVLILCGLCTSVMWGGIFNLAVEGLGKYTAQASGIFMMMVVGGGVLPLIQQGLSDTFGYMASYWLIIAALGYLLFYGLVGSKNVNKDIPV
ncbi:MAG: MFS transporter [Prevotellaceae bacterium]|jgi:FHS family L-fucose permease-like MFS transporter|nr:MFS transporter [Prevotellaceae bacterium]